MKRYKLLFLLVVTAAVTQQANAQSVLWARKAWQCSGPDRLIEGAPTVADPHSNVYVTGRNAGTCAAFGTDTVANPAVGTAAAIYLVSYDSFGNFRWVRHPSDVTNNAVSENISGNDSGQVFMAGMFFDDSVTFGTSTLYATSGGVPDYLVKYDSSGNMLWLRSCTSSGNVTVCAVAAAHDGGCYLLGSFFGNTITFGPYTLTNSGFLSIDLFLVRYDAAGNVLWARQAGGSANETAYSVACDGSNNAYITGMFQSPSLTFGSATLVNSNPSNNNVFIAKYDPSGSPLWATQIPIQLAPSAGFGYPAVAVDHSDNLFVTGVFEGDTLMIGTYDLHNASMGTTDLFVAKYSPSGSVLWAKRGGGTADDFGFEFAFDAAGNTWLTGGAWGTSITIDTTTAAVPSSPGSDASFTVTFDPYGHVINITTRPFGGDDELGIAADPAGAIYLGGDYIGGPFIAGPDTLDTMGAENFFVLRMRNNLLGSILNTPAAAPKSNVTIHPNPANGLLTVECSMPADERSAIYIINAFGQTLKTVPISSAMTNISTSDLPPGFYICRTEISGSVTVQKLLVAH